MTAYRISTLYDGVLNAVCAAFPKAVIHEILPMQGLAGGEFFCGLYSADTTPLTAGRVQTAATFEVLYAPAEGAQSAAATADILLGALEQLTLQSGTVVRTSTLEAGRTEDGLLRVTARYLMTARPAEEESKMQAMDLEVNA